jgi:hypothetical protein
MARGPSARTEKAPMEPVSSPGVRQGKPKNASEGRIKTFGGGSSVAKGDLGPRNSWPIVNGD